MKKTLFAVALASATLCALPAFAQDSQTAPPAGGNFQPSQPIGSGN